MELIVKKSHIKFVPSKDANNNIDTKLDEMKRKLADLEKQCDILRDQN